MSSINACNLANGFKLKEKIFSQVTFFGMMIVGTMGILLVDSLYVIPYIFIAWYGIPGIIQRHIVCPRCPHLLQHGDCLQLHPAITKRLINKQKGPKFSLSEKIIFIAIMVLIPVYPLYWLSFKIPLLILFLLLAGLWYGAQFFHFCKRCRVKGCPFNRAVPSNSL